MSIEVGDSTAEAHDGSFSIHLPTDEGHALLWAALVLFFALWLLSLLLRGRRTHLNETFADYISDPWLFVLLCVGFSLVLIGTRSRPLELELSLGFVALVLGLVALADIRIFHRGINRTLEHQRQVEKELEIVTGSHYVERAIDLYAGARTRIVSLMRMWGGDLSTETQNKMAHVLKSVVRDASSNDLHIVFSGPIKRGPDLAKVLWRWSLVRELRRINDKVSIQLWHHEEIHTVFTVVDDHVLIGWTGTKAEIRGAMVPKDHGAAELYWAIANRLFEVESCPVLRESGNHQHKQDRCLPLEVRKGEEVIGEFIRHYGTRGNLKNLLSHLLTDSNAPPYQTPDATVEFARDVLLFLVHEMNATIAADKTGYSLPNLAIKPLATPAGSRSAVVRGSERPEMATYGRQSGGRRRQRRQ